MLLATAGFALAAAPAASVTDRVYWSNFGTDAISFTALDASTAGNVATTGASLNDPYGTAIDAAAERIYWANAGANKISFANLNGAYERRSRKPPRLRSG